jgi:hypothetical protein
MNNRDESAMASKRIISSLRSRRSFVFGLPLGLAAVTASSPFWDRLIRRATAQQSAGQRFLVWYTADGTVPEWYWPSEEGALEILTGRTTDLSGRDFNEGIPNADRPTFIQQPIANYADRTLMVHGVSNPGQGDHAPAVRSMFTGEALSGEENEGSSPSLDTVVADALTTSNHAEAVLRTGVYGNRVSYNGTRDLSRPSGGGFVEPSWQPVSDARQVLDAVGGLTTAPGVDNSLRAASRLAVLGSVRDRVEALRCAAGTPAALKLEAYVEEVARLERLEQEMGDAPQAEPTEPLVDPSDPDVGEAERDIRGLPTMAPFVRDLAVTSLALDYSPVVTIQWGASGENKIQGGELTDFRYDFLPDLEYPGAGDHGLAHPEDGAFQDAGHRITAAVSTRDRVRIQRWFYGQLAQLLDRLDSIPDGTGTLLDNTTVLCVSEFGGPNANSTAAQHSTNNLPFMLVGGQNTPFDTGKFLRVDRSHADYLLTVARGFGSSISAIGISEGLIDGIIA